MIKRRKVENLAFLVIICFQSLFFLSFGLNPLYISLLLFWGIYFLYLKHTPLKFREALSQMFLLNLGLVISFFIINFVLPKFPLFSTAVPIMSFGMFSYLLFGNYEVAIFINLFLSLCVGLLINSLDKIFILFISSLVSLLLLFKQKKRPQIIKAALLAGILQLLLHTSSDSFNVLREFNLFKKYLYSDLGNSIFSFIFVLGALPLFEHFFGVVTNIRLLELSATNHPLLKRLNLEAPGTYLHSLIVANLAESAAESIGANSLLARVGAYFHDVGKIPKAEYFVENQLYRKDRHKTLTPTMSKLVIINHVKEGVELAKKYGLPQPIIDFISQHHGTSLISYFYHQATRNLTEDEKEKMENEFRYPGPKPQTKETAIVLLADSIEAASRVLEDPTPSRIKELVKEIIRVKLEDGQLDESGLNLKELEKIEGVFARLLTALFHARVEYPKIQNATDKSSQQSKKDTDTSQKDSQDN